MEATPYEKYSAHTFFSILGDAALAADLFSSDKTLEIEIHSDFPYRSFAHMEEKNLEIAKKYPSQVRFPFEGRNYIVESKIEARGSGRLNHCQFAPFKIKVKKKIAENPLFEADANYKIVTHCLEGSDTWSQKADEFLLKEYLLYKILELSGVESFKTRLVHIKYKTIKNSDVEQRLAFIIEPNEMFKRRHSITEPELDEEGVKALLESLQKNITGSQDLSKILSQFINYENFVGNRIGQLMILNADWSPSPFQSMGNVKAFLRPDKTVLNVHYDFDLSSLVGKFEPTKRMHYSYPISCEADRAWIGEFLEEKSDLVQASQKHLAFSKTIQTITGKRNNVLQYLKTFDMLPALSKQEIINRLEIFYDCFQ